MPETSNVPGSNRGSWAGVAVFLIGCLVGCLMMRRASTEVMTRHETTNPPEPVVLFQPFG